MKIKTLHLKFILVCLIASIPLAIQGGFADSDVYSEQAIYTWANGLLGGGGEFSNKQVSLNLECSFYFILKGYLVKIRHFF